MAKRQPLIEEGFAVEVASKRDVSNAVRVALRELGLTAAELEREARVGSFSSERARIVWSAIRDLGTSA